MKKNNYWGEPDDEPLPDWMNPETYRNSHIRPRPSKSLNEAIQECLRKPAIPIVITEPKE